MNVQTNTTWYVNKENAMKMCKHLNEVSRSGGVYKVFKAIIKYEEVNDDI
jgi:hypothetical protein